MSDEVRLIDANALLSEVYGDGDLSKKETRTAVLLMIEKSPTVEAQPVKQGRWEVNGDRFYPFCSNCKYEPPKELIRCNALSLEPILTKYCPNCGFENGTRIYKGGEKANMK